MKTVIILNAPPYSGKDTIADLVVKHIGATKQEFKTALYEEVAKHYKCNLEYFKNIATNRKYKDILTTSFSKEHGLSPRAALIHVSEDVIKPLHGSDFFGEQAAEALVEGLNVFADGGGWWEELAPVVQAADKVIICRMYRPGYTFEGDSRDYYSTQVPSYIADKVSMCEIHLQGGNPLAALDAIGALIL